MKPIVPLALLAALSVTGCSLAPKVPVPMGVTPPAFPQGGVYPEAGAEAVIPDLAWRAFFQDDRLRAVIAQSLDNNRDLRVAAANVLAARAQYRVQRAEQAPTIAVSGAAVYTDDPAQAGAGAQPGDDLELYSAQIGFSAFEIDLFGRLRSLSEAALQSYFATEEAQRAARISLIAETANAWLAYASVQDQLRLARETLSTYEATRDLTRAQFRIGVASELEAQQAETQYQGARNDIAGLQTQAAQARNALELLAGAPVADGLLPQGLPTSGVAAPLPPIGLSSEVLLSRPDVRQAERLMRAQNANIGAARAALFPSISLTTAYGTASTALSDLFADGSYAYSVSPGISLPIFDMGRRTANVRLAEAQRDAALATYEGAIQAAFREVSDALADRGTIDERLDSQTRRAEASRRALELSDARYRVGVSSFLQVLDAQRSAYGAEQMVIQTRLERETNRVALYRALGGGLE